MAELLPLLPLVQLPHHPLLGGHALVRGHAEVAEPVVGVLVVAGEVACDGRGAAAGREARRLWQRLIGGGVHRAGFGLQWRSSPREVVLSRGSADTEEHQTYALTYR